jgi:hypothetical protein
MARAISWMAYIWLITSETLDELFNSVIVDSVRQFVFTAEIRAQAPRAKCTAHPSPKHVAKATDVI